MHVVADRILEESTTSGVGDFSLNGAVVGHRRFSTVCSVGDTFHYVIEAVNDNGTPSGDWEIGLGTYSAANVLERTSVLKSSNADNHVAFSSGTKSVWLDFPASELKDFGALVAMSTTGIAVRTTTSTWATRTLVAPAAGITVANGDGVAGNPTLALANDLAALEGLASTGIAVRSAADTWVQRLIAGTTDRISVSNGDGVAGNPVIDIAATYVGQSSITTLGTITTGTWAASFPSGGGVLATGEIGVRSAPLADRSIYFTLPSSANSTLYGVLGNAVLPATATSTVSVYQSQATTVASVFTAGTVLLFHAAAITKGAGASITTAAGFKVAAEVGGTATYTYGFLSDLATAPNTWQLYMGGTAQSYFGGGVGILTNGPIAASFAILAIGGANDHPSSNNTLNGVLLDFKIPTTGTNNVYGIFSRIRSTASAFTAANVSHFIAGETVKGAGSTISAIWGFNASGNIVNDTAGSTTYGFYSSINVASAATAYQLYMSGTAPSLVGGRLQVGTFPMSNVSLLRVHAASVGDWTTGDFGNVAILDGGVPSNFTTAINGFASSLTTAAASFSLNTLRHFGAFGAARGAGSAITNVYGFYAANGIAVGTVNYGFYSTINTAANTYQLYMAGTAPSYFGGPVGILTTNTVASGALFRLGADSLHPAGTAHNYVVHIDMSAPSTATTSLVGVYSVLRTQNATFTCGLLSHFYAGTTVRGSASTITSVIGFFASNAIAVGSSNYGFYSTINDATNTYQLYMAGTAGSFFGGHIALRVTPSPDVLVYIGGGTTHRGTGSTTYSVYSNYVAPQTATANAYGYVSILGTSATTFTIAGVTHYQANATYKGAGSTISSVFGFRVLNAIATGTNNYGFHSDIAAATNTYQLYMAGTALNFLKGGTILDTTAAPTVGANQVGLGATVATTVGAAGAASALPATPDGYWIINVAGTQKKVPYYAT